VDQLLSIRGEIPSVERVIYWDLRGMRAYSDAWLLPLWELTGQQPPADRQAASPASFQKGTVDAGARDRFMTMLTALRSEAAAEVVFTPAPTEHRGAYASATPT
jgi:hypothetical protein